jgi:lipopolysaccharide transport system permease protein
MIGPSTASADEVAPEAAGRADPGGGAGPPVTVIGPPRGWQPVDVRELWRFRELVYFLIWRDVKVRYKQTVLGAAWAVLQPALMMAVFTIFFGRLAGVSSGGLPYPLFAYAGLLPWSFFATSITNGGNSVVASERLITKVYFPRLAIPLAAVGAAAVDFVVAFGLLLAMMAYYGVAPGAGMLLAPVVAGTILLAGVGFGTLLAALNVAYRDFRYVIPFLVQLGMFATPAVYMQVDAAASPGLVRTALALNPMNGQVAAFRAATLGGRFPWEAYVASTAGVVLACLAGCLYFRKVEDDFADII